MSNLISLDGYASGPGGDVMALPFATTFSDYNLELMQAADTLVSGATTYRGFPSYWPQVADDPTQPEVERAISRRHCEVEHFVVSDSLTAEETGPWREKTTIVRKVEARDVIARAKKREGRALVAFGSMMTWNDLLAAGLVDELHIMVGAGVLLDGVPAFSARPPGPMRLTAARQLGASNIALCSIRCADGYAAHPAASRSCGSPNKSSSTPKALYAIEHWCPHPHTNVFKTGALDPHGPVAPPGQKWCR